MANSILTTTRGEAQRAIARHRREIAPPPLRALAFTWRGQPCGPQHLQYEQAPGDLRGRLLTASAACGRFAKARAVLAWMEKIMAGGLPVPELRLMRSLVQDLGAEVPR
jgi:hypothetical protein